MMSHHRLCLVAFDMEGVLTAEPTLWEIMHRRLGTWESHGRRYWERYCAGEFCYDEFARMDVAVWRGAPLTWLQEAAYEVPLIAGSAEVMSRLGAGGVRLTIITNGLICLAKRLQHLWGVEFVYANDVRSEDGYLTGEIDLHVPYAAKGAVLRKLMATLGLKRGEVAAVGDSIADITMFRQAGISVAFRPTHPSVAAAATHSVCGPDLLPLLEIILPRRGKHSAHGQAGGLMTS